MFPQLDDRSMEVRDLIHAITDLSQSMASYTLRLAAMQHLASIQAANAAYREEAYSATALAANANFTQDTPGSYIATMPRTQNSILVTKVLAFVDKTASGPYCIRLGSSFKWIIPTPSSGIIELNFLKHRLDRSDERFLCCQVGTPNNVGLILYGDIIPNAGGIEVS